MPKKENDQKKEGGLLRFGESYTSLVLGIVVVIVATVLLLSFVNSKNANRLDTSTMPAEKIAKIDDETKEASEAAKVSPTVTAQPSTKPTSKPTAVPTVKASPTTSKKVIKVDSKKQVKATASPTPAKKVAQVDTKVVKKGTYVVKKGDTLWSIAEKSYKSGYNWVDIARVNKLSNPDQIEAGMKLTLPKVKSKLATVTPTLTQAKKAIESKKVEQKKQPEVDKKITGTEYKVVRGDTLWNISVRAYGDGYQWVKIAKANKLANPDLIHAGNKLKIPRK